MSKADSSSIETSVLDAPVTYRRPVPVHLPENIYSPGTPRANVAITPEMPDGSKEFYTSKIGDRWKSRSVLQQHITYFDRDNDGVVTPWDTFIGFWYLGFNIMFSAFAAFVIHMAMSYSTQNGIIPDPRFYIHIKNIHRAKHGSDSETFDTEGRWVAEKFEEVFSKYARSDSSKQTITYMEMFELIKSQRNAFDPFGWAAAFFEWGTTYMLIGNKGRMRKEDVRGVLDGSLFYRIRDDRLNARRMKARGGQKRYQPKEEYEPKEHEKPLKELEHTREPEKQPREPERPTRDPREQERQSKEHERQSKEHERQSKEHERPSKEHEKSSKEPKEHERWTTREHHDRPSREKQSRDHDQMSTNSSMSTSSRGSKDPAHKP